MKKLESMGTVVEGQLKLDQPITLPDNSRVRVAVEPLESRKTKFTAGFRDWKSLCEQRPIHSGGQRYTRDELHERP